MRYLLPLNIKNVQSVKAFHFRLIFRSHQAHRLAMHQVKLNGLLTFTVYQFFSSEI